MQSMIFMAGASGVMIGDYLTTKVAKVFPDLGAATGVADHD